MFPVSLLMNPWLILGAVFAIFSSCTTGYVAGRKHESNKWKAAEAEQLAQQIKDRDAYLANVAEMVKLYNEKKEKTRVVYRTIREEVPVETTGAKCLGAGATGLWNKGLAGEVVLPGAAAGAADSPAGNGATDTEVLGNAITNFEQYKQCRDQLNALIDWKEKTYGR